MGTVGRLLKSLSELTRFVEEAVDVVFVETCGLFVVGVVVVVVDV